jgi:hypothetical protein
MKWTPATSKVWLHLTAGIMWSGVGLMLMLFATGWLEMVHSWMVLLFILAGLLLATAIYFFGFSKLASSNRQRINDIPKEKVCLFAFQKWTSYPLVLVMVAMGIYLRRYSPIPKPTLAILYLGLGASLFTSSLKYYAQVFQVVHTRNPIRNPDRD